MKLLTKLFAGAAVLVTGACATDNVLPSGLTSGGGSAAGGETSVNSEIYRCSEALGTLAVDEEDTGTWRGYYQQTTGLSSVEPVIRQMVQESNCFIIVAGVGSKQQQKIDKMRKYSRESGEIRAGSNTQAGQQVNADYVLFPEILFAGQDTGGTTAGALGGVIAKNLPFGGIGGISTKSKSTQVNMSIWDVRAGVQLVTSTGEAKATNFDFGGIAIAGIGGGAFKTASKTPEGKATMAAFVAAYNNAVVSMQNYKKQSVEGGAGTGGKLGID